MAMRFKDKTILRPSEWRVLADAHEREMEPWLSAFRYRRKRGRSHPTHDFLFVYYDAPAYTIEKWHPGLGLVLEGEEAEVFLKDARYRKDELGVSLSLEHPRSPFEQKRLLNIKNLLKAAEQRAARFQCYGLHEWAMVYKADAIRHENVPLRLSPAEVDRLVESLPIACSHYDAFRFFTPEAVPLNTLQPQRDDRAQWEQCGCLHFNMDLYRWAYELYPWTGSQLIADCFDLAMKARILDMQASPYDLTEYELEPIKIETPAGREEYQAQQKHISEAATPLRHRLLQVCETLISFDSKTP